ncbi:uncharacterized protein LOC110449354 [Mizuhopecten yessoensis]|uniref:TIR domain-containing protein n=1 Tax=Mizuhopecten yessoensis TaxID=6573 RepID=A0A210QRL8_MIZYE|nr:uncharacterized protein LOC110449354 [Mizuhopecten yessoensis]XP_021351848.1 uncharacterized protein LOC110449354 [Mizuhopecten yessoensis]OWF51328.1 hypothetical protein KP79_PYT24680 [Mizuhopecten yessoensis]
MAEEDSVQLLHTQKHNEGVLKENASTAVIDIVEPDSHRVSRRQLPSGKKYHFFLSFSSSDNDQATVLAKHLEEERGFKCMLADYDFLGNRTVYDNIENAINQSEKIIFLVSDAFLNSHYCNNEVSFAYTYSSDNRVKDFMIVLKSGCFDDSLFPLKLKSLSYIKTDGKELDEIGQRIANAFDNIDDAAVEDIVNNGSVMCVKQLTEISKSLCGGLACEFESLNKNERHVLKHFEIEAAEEDYDNITNMAEKREVFKRHSLVVSSKKCALSWFCWLTGSVAMLCPILVILVWAYNGVHSPVEWVVVIAAILGILIISCTAHCVFGRVRFRKAYRTLHDAAKAQLVLTGEKKFLVLPLFDDGKGSLWIVFRYYDMKPCWDFLIRRAEQTQPGASLEQIQEMCKEALEDTIMNRYAGRYTITGLTYPKVKRHPTVDDTSCLCQMVPDSCLVKTKKTSKQLGKIEDDPDQTHVMEIVGVDNLGLTSENADLDETHVMAVFGMENKKSVSLENDPDQTFVVREAMTVTRSDTSSETDQTNTLTRKLNNREEIVSQDTTDSVEIISEPDVYTAETNF